MKLLPRVSGWLLLALLSACASPLRSPAHPPAAEAPSSAATIAGAPRVPSRIAQALADPRMPAAPAAARHPHTVVSANGNREDEYYWLRDDTRTNPEVLGYLARENEYYEAAAKAVAPLADAVYGEIVSRIKPDDATVPARKGGWWYYQRYEPGREHAVYARRADAGRDRYDPAQPEQVLIDGNARGAGKGFFQVGNYEVTRDGRRLAWVEDTSGRRQWVLHIKDLVTGKESPETIGNIEDSLAWADDGRTLVYVEKDPVTLLGIRVRKHVAGSDPARDPVVYEEKDHSYYLSVGKSRSDRFVEIYLSSTVATEQRVADAADPKLVFKVVLPRQRDHEYQAEDHGSEWIIRSNWQAKNFRIVAAPMDAPDDRTRWRDLVAARDDAFVEEFLSFDGFLATTVNMGGIRRVRLSPWDGSEAQVIAPDEIPSTLHLGDNPEVGSRRLRFRYSALVTPDSIYDYDLGSRTRTLMKRDPVLGDFDPARYASDFVFATARDGARIPVSLLYRRDFRRDGTAALYQFAYGSYGSSTDPSFRSSWLSLVDRGMVVAIAHVRGGEELGRDWYDQGHLLAKKNTFTDFIDVSDFLVREKYAAPGRIAAHGRSAGGLLMGAIANLAPDRYGAILADVPFVDAVTTMLDETIPLTSNEFDEWGDPKDKTFYDYILSYSPYDNVAARDYPPMRVTTGLWDSQVQYYEPAKWVARLRARKTDHNPLLFRINMEAGHGGKSGRYEHYRETADGYAFVLDQLGVR